MSNIHKQIFVLVLMAAFALPVSFSAIAQNSEWVPVSGADDLQAFMSGRTMDRGLVGGGPGIPAAIDVSGLHGGKSHRFHDGDRKAIG